MVAQNIEIKDWRAADKINYNGELSSGIYYWRPHIETSQLTENLFAIGFMYDGDQLWAHMYGAN